MKRNLLKMATMVVVMGLTVAFPATAQQQPQTPATDPVWSIGCSGEANLGVDAEGTRAKKTSVCYVQILSTGVFLSANGAECADQAEELKKLTVVEGALEFKSVKCSPYAMRTGNSADFEFTPPQQPGEYYFVFRHGASTSPQMLVRVYDPTAAGPPGPPGPPGPAGSGEGYNRYALRIGGAFTPDVIKLDSWGGSADFGYSPWGRDRYISGEFGGYTSLMGTHTPISNEGLPANMEDENARTYTLSFAATGSLVIGAIPEYLYFNLGLGVGAKAYFKNKEELQDLNGRLVAQDDAATQLSPLVTFQLVAPITLGETIWIGPGARVELAPLALIESGSGAVGSNEDIGLDVHFTVMAAAGFYLDASGFTTSAPRGTEVAKR